MQKRKKISMINNISIHISSQYPYIDKMYQSVSQNLGPPYPVWGSQLQAHWIQLKNYIKKKKTPIR